MIRLFEVFKVPSRWEESETNYVILADSFESVVSQLKRKFNTLSNKVHKPEFQRTQFPVTIYDTYFDDFGVLQINYESKQIFEI